MTYPRHWTGALRVASIVGLGFPVLAAEPVDFARQVRPILAGACFQCHGPDDGARKARLRLDTADGATAALRSGHRAVVPGRPEGSELIARITSADESSAMPPRELGRRLGAAEVDVLRRWIAQGAPYARHWAYVTPVRPELPAVSRRDWPRNGIDRFILSRLEQERLSPSAEADRHTLLRRVALDLTGLPPAPEAADRFASDESQDSYELAVDSLLASPTHGERWASTWLDLARYADSAGYIHDPPRTIWRFRDWLIQALNANLGYDQLTVELLAGDLLPGATLEQVIASGFHRNTTTNTEGGSSAEEFHFASVVDRVNTTFQVWMGTTLACAQCHNHKYDPFTQKEYYQVFAIFNNTADFNSEDPAIEVPRVGCEEEYAALKQQLGEARSRRDEEAKRIDALQAGWEVEVDRAALPKEAAAAIAVAAGQRTPAQREQLAKHHRSLSAAWRELDQEARRLEAAVAACSTTTLVCKEIAPRPTTIAIRGNFRSKGEAVEPGVPAILHRPEPKMRLDRLGFARWLVDARNPLSARVAANRLWQQVFGVGLIENSEELGTQGELPSHPELLDWLATEYVRLGWDTKRFLRLLVTSATYRQSSSVSEEAARHDPFNRLLARGPRVRLSAEALRDQALRVSGLLSTKIYGPPAQPFQPVNGLAAAFGASTDWETSQGEDRYRRALYTRWRRNLPYPSMVTFDVPERSVCSLRRVRTNTPLQALVTLNDPAFVEAAQALARRVLREGGGDDDARAAFALRQALARPPSANEVREIAALVADARASLAGDPARATALATRPLGALPPDMDAAAAAAWTVAANVLFNLDEVLTKR